jgi:hypothetical protein
MRLVPCVVVLALLASRVEAAPITYSDRTAFQAALGQFQTYDFSNPTVSIDPIFGMDLLSYSGLTVFVDRANGQTTIDAVQNGEIADPTKVVQFVFSLPRFAFGFDVDTAGAFRLGVRGMDGGWESGGSYGLTSSGFFGVIFDAPIAGATIFPWSDRGVNANVTVDNLTTNSVPEPAFLWALGAAAGLAWRRRRAPSYPR